ncbi:hypothetical protein JY651_36265 [Pyxidicoccus parkwayensis]|uniref:Lipoprotein n=1 Tax=Pyxidicoccus parkwayensis TaxID=2813578 RepID=A0ABX7NP69_9BACT|nr:hypothetical protein [Pyxidicoccus parkwaysis]QSQ20651.1 hypothetical protein JY651_36265 [Pyxidicoccus parkwaysis]
MHTHWMKWTLPFVAGLGLVGCGGDDTRVYDVTFDAAALEDVPTTCSDVRGGPRKAAGLEAHQTWTIRDVDYGATTLEVPDVDFTLSDEDYFRIDSDDSPDILGGTAKDKGPFQYVDIRTQDAAGDLPIRRVVRYYIDNDSLGGTIKGYLWLRSEYGVDRLPDDKIEECVSTIPFTGTRIQE